MRRTDEKVQVWPLNVLVPVQLRVPGASVKVIVPKLDVSVVYAEAKSDTERRDRPILNQ